ncbi:MAG: hypothetical protein KA144_01700 [Xanthomonadaceae bacterium]|nr:hypothetical protein [Xanthomonadaceae bacterium]
MAAACSAVATFFRSHASILLFLMFAAAFVAVLIGCSNSPGKRRSATVVDGMDLLSGLLELLTLFF